MKERPQVERDSRPPIFLECGDQAEEPQMRAQVEQAGWLCRQLRGVFAQVCGLGAQGWREGGQWTVGSCSQRWV